MPVPHVEHSLQAVDSEQGDNIEVALPHVGVSLANKRDDVTETQTCIHAATAECAFSNDVMNDNMLHIHNVHMYACAVTWEIIKRTLREWG